MVLLAQSQQAGPIRGILTPRLVRGVFYARWPPTAVLIAPGKRDRASGSTDALPPIHSYTTRRGNTMTIKICDRLPEGTLTEYIETETEG